MDDILNLHQTTDCAVWEEAFMKTFPNCGIPEGTMIGWFANAMMAKADSLAALTPASDGRAEAEDGPADRLRAFLAARDACDYDDDEIDYIVGKTAEDVARLLASDIRALLARAAELEKADE